MTALTTPNVVFINLAEYFNYSGKIFQPYSDDDVLWKVAQDWLAHDGEDSLTAWSNPEIKHSNKKLKCQGKIFGQSITNYTEARGLRNALSILKLWSALTHFTLEHFNYDLASQAHLSLSKISLDIIWLMYAGQAGPLAHPQESLHPHSVFQLRPWCKGGFSYSFQDYLKMDHPLSVSKEKAKSIRELDLSSAYGYSGMTMKCAKGFGLTFGEQVKTQHRYKMFEYKATMYTIYKLTAIEGKRIKAVFSNYSPLGLVYIGKHALDLVVVTQDDHVLLFQFDGHFCHGDYNHPNCHTLEHYANDQSRSDCEKKTRQKDETILNWLMKMNFANSSYQVVTDCCHPEYSKQKLDQAFMKYSPLKNLISGLDALHGSIIDADLSKITFLAIVEGHIDKTNHHQPGQFGPIFVNDDNETNQPTIDGGKILLTSDYYRYLRDNFGFTISKIHWIIYYKVCSDLPKVFKMLVSMRNQTERQSPKDAFFKTIINYACGYFGLNPYKTPKKVTRIVYQLPRRFNIFRDDVIPLATFGKQDLLLIQSHFKQRQTKHLCHTALVLFIQIIEFGKQTLNSAIQCLQRHIRPTAMHILYSNVFNLIVALAGDNLLDVVQVPTKNGKEAFSLEWDQLTGDGPGRLKEEWCHTSKEVWQFVSPCRMFHVLLTHEDQESHHKSTFFTGLPTREAFTIAMSVLNKQPIQIVQERKKSKLIGTDTHMVTFNV